MDMTKQKNWLLRLIKGIIIALGFILPGASGSLLAAILGVYERLLHFLAHLTKNFKENFLFFLPIGIGGILGIGLLSRPLEYLLEYHRIIVLWTFAGLIIGTLPALSKKSTMKEARKSIDIITFFIAVIVSFSLFYFLGMFVGGLQPNFIGFVIAGIILGLSILIPGVSTSNILIIVGIYSPMLIGFRDFDLVNVYLPIMIGAGLSMILFSKFMSHLLTRHYTRTFHAILGLVISGVLLIVLPPIANYEGITVLTIIISLVTFTLGILLGRLMGKLEERYK